MIEQAAAPAGDPGRSHPGNGLPDLGGRGRQALARGKAVLVDVCPKESYDASHAQGAISIPLSDIGSRAGELPKDKLVVTCCI